MLLPSKTLNQAWWRDLMSRADEVHAPGLKRMKRHNGRVDLYWVADERAVQAGFTPKTQRLFGNFDDPGQRAEIANTCCILDAEMREWLAGRQAGRNPAPFGT